MINLHKLLYPFLDQFSQQFKPIAQALGLPLRQRFKRIGLALLSVTLAFSLISCTAEPKTPLRIGYSIWPGYESLYLARDLGYYDDKSVRLVDYPSNSEIIRAFRNNDLDAATLTMYEALLVAETNPETKIILIMDSTHGADVIIGKPDIKEMEDIKGKRMGVESGALGAFVFTRALEQSGIDPTTIEVVSLGISEHEAAFEQNLVDAIVTYEPTRSKLLAKGANQLFDSSQIPGEILDVLVVHSDMIEQRPETLQKVIDGHFKAIQYMDDNPQDAAKRIAPRERVTPEQFLESLKGIKIPDREENRELLGRRNEAVQQRVQRVSDFMHEKKLLRSPISLSSFFDDQFVQ